MVDPTPVITAAPAGTSAVALIVTAGIGAIVTIVLALLDYKRRGRTTGLTPDESNGQSDAAAAAVVEQIATGKIAAGPEAMAALAVYFSGETKSLTERVARLERNEASYLGRIGVLEWFAVNSDDPTPRKLPPWVDDPRRIA